MDVAWDDLEIEGTVRIPLLGDVAAGQPLEMYTVEDSLDVPETIWNGRKVFALRVRGQSMIEAGIHDGDYLIVEPRATADDGRTVVAEVDGKATVKKIYRERDGQIRLQPANAEMLPLLVRGEDVRILGVVVGILRKYGFASSRRPAEQPAQIREMKAPPQAHPTPRPAASHRPPARDNATLELAINAIDAQLARWKQMMEQAHRGHHDPDVVRMAELGRDLQSLRDWCARTSKPRLRQALIGEANKIMLRMERFVAARSLSVPDPVLH